MHTEERPYEDIAIRWPLKAKKEASGETKPADSVIGDLGLPASRNLRK